MIRNLNMEVFIQFVYAIQIFHVCTPLAFSNFRQTDIFNEEFDVGLIKSETKNSNRECAKECFLDVNCRRFKYCDNDVTSGQCLTYEAGQNCPHKNNGQTCHCFMKVISYKDNVYTCPIGYYGNKCENVIKHCSEGQFHDMESLGEKLSFIQPDGAAEPFEVLCEFRYGGLTTIQRRTIYAAHVDFNRTMAEYINGFGHPWFNHWLGLKRISLISKQSATKCNIQLFDSSYCQVYYDDCHIHGEADDYKLWISSYSTSPSFTKCGDSLLAVDNVNDAPFSTFDDDNSNNGCAAKMASGWWYAQTATCSQGNLNAPLATSDEVIADPSIMRMKWVNDRNDEIITFSMIRLLRTDVTDQYND